MKSSYALVNLGVMASLIQLKTPKGGDRRPTFISGDFVEAFVGERSPFEEGAM